MSTAPDDPPVFGPPIVDLTVYGTPVTQGSFDPSKNGSFRHAKKNELLEWRNLIERAVRRHRGPGAATVEGPVVTSLVFIAHRIQSPKWGALPCGIEGDVDKLVRAAHDGLGRNRQKDTRTGLGYYTGAEVMRDDNRVVFTIGGKVYADEDDPPGVMIRVWEVDPAAAKAGWVPVPDWPGWRYVRRSDLLNPLIPPHA